MISGIISAFFCRFDFKIMIIFGFFFCLICITIGNENESDEMSDCSLITATYHVDGKLIGKLGVIGPTRMKYSEVTSVIEYLTDNISNTFKIGDGKEDD